MDKLKFISLKEFKGGSVTLGDNESTKIMEKGIDNLGNEKAKAEYVMLVKGLKHNTLSVSQMIDEEHEVTFNSKGFEIGKEGFGKLVANKTNNLDNLHILNKGKGKDCCMSV